MSKVFLISIVLMLSTPCMAHLFLVDDPSDRWGPDDGGKSVPSPAPCSPVDSDPPAPGDGDIGLSFDPLIFYYRTNAAPISHVDAYIVYRNPLLPFVRGFECQVSYLAGDNNTSISSTLPVPGTDVGVKAAPVFNFIVGFDTPLATTSATVLTTLDLFYLNFASPSMDLYLGPADPSSSSNGMPVVVREDFTKLDVRPWIHFGYPAAMINSPECAVAEWETSFGSLKALFR